MTCKGTNGTSPKIDLSEAQKVDTQAEEMHFMPGRVDCLETLCPSWM